MLTKAEMGDLYAPSTELAPLNLKEQGQDTCGEKVACLGAFVHS